MKLPPFDYAVPTTLQDAIGLLSASAGEARVLAGGQSLLPVMAFRLASPAKLVDLRLIPGLRDIEVDDSVVRLGAMARWRDIADHSELAEALPLLPAAVSHVAHYQIQNRGTIGGSLAHADPAAEFPGIAVACDAIVEIIGPGGLREVAAADLFVGPMETSLAADDIIVGIRFARWRSEKRWAFQEFSRRRGDFAIAAIALHYDVSTEGKIVDAHVVAIGATDKPRRLARSEAALEGSVLDDDTIKRASNAASVEVDPPRDLHGSVDYRRSLVQTLLERALRQTLNWSAE